MMLRQWSSNSDLVIEILVTLEEQSRTTPHLRNEIPGMIVVDVGLWLTVRLHPNHRLLGARKLICMTKSTKW